ncbi:MAG: 3-phosphoshikimate 1-carboxyvinyltransferase [Verrucomicrobiales bacterium]
MALPNLIEIIPLSAPVQAEVTVPGSKSITNRALILAALSSGRCTLKGALWSEDTQVMVECLKHLGFQLAVEHDPAESCNRTIHVEGKGGQIPNAGTPEQPLELFVGNAGTAARFLAAFLCLGRGSYRLAGIARMHQRPQAALFQGLRELGYQIDTSNDKLPAVIHGTGPRKAECKVSITESSQFASALLLCAEIAGWTVKVVDENADESPYVTMTSLLVEQFRSHQAEFLVEPDASSGSYIYGADWLLKRFPSTHGSIARVKHWPSDLFQVDARFAETIARFPSVLSRQEDLGDSIMTAIALGPFADGPRKFVELGRLRVQECERVMALRTELTRCGALVIERDDSLEIQPTQLHGAEIETYNDHRMAMSFATLGLVVPGMIIRNPGCVKKTFPNFFAKLADPAPEGFGVQIRNKANMQILRNEELLAE